MNNPMSWLRFVLPALLALAVGAFFLRAPEPVKAAQRQAVVVELFTSEGCSSCPPADELLAGLQGQSSTNGAQIIPLGFHVDYWNYLGWEDRFSSRAYSERQEQYADRFRLNGPYTPQMVVDGASEFVGNSSRSAQASITEAAARPEQVHVELSPGAPGKITVRALAVPGGNAGGDVILAVTEDNLSTKVGAGENDGRVLRHAAVVRRFEVLGEMKDGRFKATVPLQAEPGWKLPDLRVVSFVQVKSREAITGAVSLPWSSLAGTR